MVKTLKTIKIIFSVDVDKFQKNLKALGRSVDVATKKVEEANKGISDSNEKISKSNEQVAQSTQKVADATAQTVESTKKSNAALQLLGKALGFAKTGLDVLVAGMEGFGRSITASVLIAVKFHRALGVVAARSAELGAAVAAAGETVFKFGVSLVAMNLSLFAMVQNIGVAIGERGFPRLGLAILTTSKSIALFVNNMSGVVQQTGLALVGIRGVSPVLDKVSKGFTASKVALTGFLGKLVKTGEEMPRVNAAWQKLFKFLAPVALAARKVGIAFVPLLAKLLSFAAILPGVGALVVFFAAKLAFKLGKALFNAASNALKLATSLAPVADALAKTSSKLGINVEKLQQYQFAANLAGVKTEALNVGLQRFLRRTAEARQGTGVLKREFDALGIALVDSLGNVRQGADVFEDYLASISKTADKQEQLRLAFAAFDTEGVALVNLAKQGRDAFAEQRAEAERLGLVLSAGLLRSYEEINDQMTINVKRVEAARLKNSLFLAEMGIKWDNFKTSVKVATLELLAFLRPLEASTVPQLTQALAKVQLDISATNAALGDTFKSIPLITGVLEAQLGFLIGEAEELQALIDKAKGDETPVKAGRADLITQQIEKQIELQERRLEQQKRLVEAAKDGEDARARVAIQIEAENAARALGLEATEAERASIMATTVATLEADGVLQQLAITNRDVLAGEELRVGALSRIVGVTERSNTALLTTVKTLLITTDATRRMRRDFDQLETALNSSVKALAAIKVELAKGAGATEQSKKKYRELGKEADRLKREIDKARNALEKMREKLGDQAAAALIAGNGIRSLGNSYVSTTGDLSRYNAELDRNRQKLEQTAAAADGAAKSIGGVGRASRSLGPVVSGDVNDPANIQRALNNLEAQLMTVSRGGDVYGFSRIQKRALRTEITRLEADLQVAMSQMRQDITRAIVSSVSSSGLTGQQMEDEVARQLQLQSQLGLLPSSTSSLQAFQTMSSR